MQRLLELSSDRAGWKAGVVVLRDRSGWFSNNLD
jgi:hypothetical protein